MDETEPALTTAALTANGIRQDYIRATRMVGPDGIGHVTPLPSQDSSLSRARAHADCLIIRAPEAPAAAAGSPVT
ncbi:hypothetical protein ABTD55_23935, partial [Acinetobacter baumannii]